jgi:hypothetical protein
MPAADPVPADAPRGRTAAFERDPEILAAIALFSAIAVIGLVTVGDYGIGVDEFNADDYGPKSLAWYTSGFTDRSSFETVENTLWFYGPWFHMLTAFVQSLGLADHWTVRHTLTFLAGLAGIAAVVPMARLAIGRWAGLAALGLCLSTGYLYGSFFFTPIDVPFLLAVTWATFAIMVMAARTVPSWPATVGAGILTGLAIATRSSGLITHAYLIGAMTLCALEAIVTTGTGAWTLLLRIGIRTISAMVIAWVTAIALWPWLQVGNPFANFKIAFVYFANHPSSWEFPHWGAMVKTTNLPWSYVPEQLVVRLPEGFLLLLIAGCAAGIAVVVGFLRSAVRALARRGMTELAASLLTLAHSRQALIVWAAAVTPIMFIIVQRSTLYDGIRHVLFLIPMLAVIAAFGLFRLLPVLNRFKVAASLVVGAYASYAVWMLVVLHPLEYISFNVLAGGVHGANQRFDQDYWSVAATPALRRLERRLDYEGRFLENPPSVMMCIAYRESLVAPLFRRRWRLEVVAEKADYIIATERSTCARDLPVTLIDEVKRFDRTFAWVYARKHSQSAAETPEER